MKEQAVSTAKAGPAQHLIDGDVINVNLVATKPDGSRQGAGAIFNHRGEAITTEGKTIPGSAGLDVTLLAGSAQPEFPLAKYNELLNQGSTEAAEDLRDAYEMDLEEWKAEGNVTLEDSIAAATLDWAKRVHGIHDQDVGDAPYVKPEHIVVKGVNRATPTEAGMFIVQITPAWGGLAFI